MVEKGAIAISVVEQVPDLMSQDETPRTYRPAQHGAVALVELDNAGLGVEHGQDAFVPGLRYIAPNHLQAESLLGNGLDRDG